MRRRNRASISRYNWAKMTSKWPCHCALRPTEVWRWAGHKIQTIYQLSECVPSCMHTNLLGQLFSRRLETLVRQRGLQQDYGLPISEWYACITLDIVPFEHTVLALGGLHHILNYSWDQRRSICASRMSKMQWGSCTVGFLNWLSKGILVGCRQVLRSKQFPTLSVGDRENGGHGKEWHMLRW